METSLVTVKGQVVIPSRLREKYGIKVGTPVQFYEKDGEIRLVPLTRELIDSNVGFLGTKGKLLKALGREKKRERNR